MQLKYAIATGIAIAVVGFGTDYLLQDLPTPLKASALALVGATVAVGFVQHEKRGSR